MRHLLIGMRYHPARCWPARYCHEELQSVLALTPRTESVFACQKRCCFCSIHAVRWTGHPAGFPPVVDHTLPDTCRGARMAASALPGSHRAGTGSPSRIHLAIRRRWPRNAGSCRAHRAPRRQRFLCISPQSHVPRCPHRDCVRSHPLPQPQFACRVRDCMAGHRVLRPLLRRTPAIAHISRGICPLSQSRKKMDSPAHSMASPVTQRTFRAVAVSN